MQIFNQLEQFPYSSKPIILTIGNFDGVHRGHQTILNDLHTLALKKAHSLVLTFSNHPSTILRPHHPLQLLCTLPHRLALIEQSHIDFTISLPFTKELSELSAEEFIQHVRKFVSFTHLVLGYDAVLGCKRQGNREVIKQIGLKAGFSVHYLDEHQIENISVSSTIIREFLKKGHLEQVEKLLNRPYSILSKVFKGMGKGKQIGFPTANLAVDNLCLPPLGVYAVEVKIKSQIFQGIANLGVAPTMKQQSSPLLEVHLFDFQGNLYDQIIEVIFKRFIRSEQRFENVDLLCQQINKDMQFALNYFNSYT